jgi:ribose-phosphate pyrophosphokinase
VTGHVLHHFVDQADPACRLAGLLGASTAEIAVRRFPDGESLVTVAAPAATALVYCSLDRPNERLVELMLSVSALRDNGARRLVLVAPYLCYMRQDAAFHPGEAVSQKAVGRFLGPLADRIVTVDPHLHRTDRLEAVFPSTTADALSAAGLIGRTLADDGVDRDTIIVGPDAESRQWVEAAAAVARLDFVVGDKQRSGDRSVAVTFPDPGAIAGRPVVIIDDLVASGGTLCAAARRLAESGARRIEAVAVHALFDTDDAKAMAGAGVSRIRSTDSVAHPTNAIALAPLLAAALASEMPR